MWNKQLRKRSEAGEMNVDRRTVLISLKSSLPWLVLGSALVLATMPTWRPLVFGATLTLEDLLDLRCLPR